MVPIVSDARLPGQSILGRSRTQKMSERNLAEDLQQAQLSLLII